VKEGRTRKTQGGVKQAKQQQPSPLAATTNHKDRKPSLTFAPRSSHKAVFSPATSKLFTLTTTWHTRKRQERGKSDAVKESAPWPLSLRQLSPAAIRGIEPSDGVTGIAGFGGFSLARVDKCDDPIRLLVQHFLPRTPRDSIRADISHFLELPATGSASRGQQALRYDTLPAAVCRLTRPSPKVRGFSSRRPSLERATSLDLLETCAAMSRSETTPCTSNQTYRCAVIITFELPARPCL
jgi:hypothetical protein